jgi:macrolide transport system ATP-binding/permease protein
VPDLGLHGVSKTYAGEPPVSAVKPVDLTIRQGEFVVIEGPSGSGKSTLLNLLTTIDRPTAGSYMLGELDISELEEAELARARSDIFGFVFQSFHLMPQRSVLENVELGLLYRGVPVERRRELAREALADVGLTDREAALAGTLSGGEKQRTAIARATVGGAPVVVADEPTGNLDSENGCAVVRQLQQLVSRGTTVILVTHDAGLAAIAPRRLRMLDGVLTEQEIDPNDRDEPAPYSAVPEGRASTVRSRDLLHEALRAIQSRPGRSGLLIVAVALATGLAVATTGMSASAESQVSGRFDALRNRDVTLTLPLDYAAGIGDATALLPSDFESRLKRLKGVQHVGLLERRSEVTIAAAGLLPPTEAPLVTSNEDGFEALDADVAWAQARQGPEVHDRRTAVVGAELARAIHLGPLELSPTLELNGISYWITGVLKAARRAPDLVGAVIVPTADGLELEPLDSAKLYLSTASGAAPNVARQAPVALDPLKAEQFEVAAPLDPKTLRAQVQGDIRITLYALSGVAFLASLLGLANAMLLGVLERIGEFGLRRAIGARPVHLLLQTGVEASIIGALGGAAGVVAGLFGVLGVTITNGWVPVFDLRLVPLAVVAGAGVGVLGGAVASIRASRIQAADALRR